MSAAVSRLCTVCDRPLDGKYANAKTCENACRQKAYRERKKAKQAAAPEPRGWTEEPPTSPQQWRDLANAVAQARLERAGGYTAVEREERRIERESKRIVAA
jgi:hypothetical protein